MGSITRIGQPVRKKRYFKTFYSVEGKSSTLLTSNSDGKEVSELTVRFAIIQLHNVEPHQKYEIGKTVEISEEDFNRIMAKYPEAHSKEKINSINKLLNLA